MELEANDCDDDVFFSEMVEECVPLSPYVTRVNDTRVLFVSTTVSERDGAPRPVPERPYVYVSIAYETHEGTDNARVRAAECEEGTLWRSPQRDDDDALFIALGRRLYVSRAREMHPRAMR